MSTQTEHSKETVASGQFPTMGVVEAASAKRVLPVHFLLAAAYTYSPIFSVIAFLLNSGGPTFPFVEFTFEWYGELLANGGLIEVVRRSVTLALVVTVITTVPATATALAYHYDFWGQRGLLFLLILGIIMSGITYGVGVTLLLNEVLGLTKSPWLAVPIHAVWAFPFVAIVPLAGSPPALKENKETVRVLGVEPLSRFRNVILPQIAPTLFGAAVFAFTLSYNEATRSLLFAGNQNTMLLEAFAIAAGTHVQPYLFAPRSLITVFPMLLLAAARPLIVYNRRS